MGDLGIPDVRITVGEGNPTHREELRAILVHYLTDARDSVSKKDPFLIPENVSALPLQELVRLMVVVHGMNR